MEYLRIQGLQRLGGTVEVHGAKNSVLPLLAATLLVKGECVLHNCPDLSDVSYTLEILRCLGASVRREGRTLIVNTAGVTGNAVPQELMSEMRSSVLFLGALAAATGEVCLSLPGGCAIGQRPIDMHIKGLRQLGYSIELTQERICCRKGNACADTVVLPFPSVGATENIVLASVLLNGTTTLINAAREPEIEDLCAFLNRAGARISGASSPVLHIEGVGTLHAVEHTVIPDRIMAGTFLCISAATGNPLRVRQIDTTHLMPLLPLFDRCGCRLDFSHRAISMLPPKRLRRIPYAETRPYPGFPTDCQAPFTAMLLRARGESVIRETVFENRFLHVPHLLRFGADIQVTEQTAAIRGVRSLHGADAACTDLRGGIAMVIAALCAEGESRICGVRHIDRGYERIEEQLTDIGAAIKRENDEQEQQRPKP